LYGYERNDRILYHLFSCIAPTKAFNVGCSSFYEYTTYFYMEDLFSYHKRYGFVPYKIVRKHEISEKKRKLIP